MEHIRELIGVYDADGTPWGELRYVVGKRFGRAHCALCDITHGLVREKDEWKACRASLPVPFTAVHRDEMEADVAAAVGSTLPAVVARGEGGAVMLLGPEELDACVGEPAALVTAVETALERIRLSD